MRLSHRWYTTSGLLYRPGSRLRLYLQHEGDAQRICADDPSASVCASHLGRRQDAPTLSEG
jgi:hypothetical protein